MISSRTSLVVAITLAGCSSSPRSAYINDVSVRASDDTGYQIIEVDGTAMKRQRGSFVTYVPLGLVEPGTHTFVLQRKDASDDKLVISGVVEANKKYRLATCDDGAIQLVEDSP